MAAEKFLYCVRRTDVDGPVTLNLLWIAELLQRALLPQVGGTNQELQVFVAYI